MCKMIASQIKKGRCVDFPLAGKFLKRGSVAMFLPAIDFIESGHFKFSENEKNISPFSKQAQAFGVSTSISLTSLASFCNIDRD